MHRLTVMFMLPICLALVVGTSLSVAARNATPGAELGPPSAAECRVPPRSPADLAVLSGTPAANASIKTEAPMALPAGQPADTTTVAAITDTLRQTLACAEAGDVNRLLALYSDAFVTRLLAQPGASISVAAGTPPAGLATAPANVPPAGADRTPLVREARRLPDGRVAALVGTGGASGSAQLIVFVRSGDRWLIDEVHPAPVEPRTPEATAAPSGGAPADQLALPPVQAALADAAKQLGVGADALTVVSVAAHEWPDAALGCPKPGGFYAQVITPGYVVVIAGAGKQLEYHTDADRRFVLCSGQ